VVVLFLESLKQLGRCSQRRTILTVLSFPCLRQASFLLGLWKAPTPKPVAEGELRDQAIVVAIPSLGLGLGRLSCVVSAK
jgi:hypothetical protein